MEISITSSGVPYRKIGHCIYCNKSEGEDFTEEHIVPRGIGGNHTVDEASCTDCQKRINKFETYCQYQMLGALRVRLGLSSTNPKGPFPLYIIGDDGKVQTHQVDPAVYPRILALARWPDPGILVGRAPTADFQYGPWLGVRNDDRDWMRTNYGGKGYISPEVHPTMFCRFLAKIGLATAAAVVRPERYVPLVQELIRDGSPTPFHWVGGGFKDTEMPPQEIGVAHWVSLNWESRYLIASIRLFAFFGTPIYRVVVAKSRENELAPIQYPPDTRHVKVLFKLREGSPFPELP